jgi:hypothetical protein
MPSEKGYLEMAGRDAGLPLREQLMSFRDLVSADMAWVDSRKIKFRWRASAVRLATLALTAASTVVLGIDAIPGRATIALPMVAAVTVLAGLEGFHNWRSRWVLMEEALYRLNRLRDEMDLYLVSSPVGALLPDDLDRFFVEQQRIWADVSTRWIEFRKLQATSPVSAASIDSRHPDPPS